MLAATCRTVVLCRILSLPGLSAALATGFSAGLVASIAGGGGIISLPVPRNFGLPAQLAPGTNKSQAFFGSVAVSWPP